MAANSTTLETLELYLQQLFSGNAGNEQIQRIHQALESFSKQKGAWKDSLYFLSQTSNQQTAMYSLTVLEGFITKGWHGLSNDEQVELRTTLYQWLLDKHQLVPYFIRNKAVQLVVHIARSDWPDKFPEFYNNILMLISSTNTSSTILGLLFLQTASEELGTPRDDLLSTRKIELKQKLLHLVPHTLSILTGLLQNIWEKHAHSITSTPPPSPTLPSLSGQQQQQLTASGCTPLHSEAEPVARLALQCLTHLFSWIPLSNHVTPQLMELVFRFVSMGTETSLPQLSTSNELSVPVVALGTINEMLYKNCVPAEFENFVVLLFNNSCIILHHLVHNSNNGHLPQQTRPQYVEKLVELVHLLMTNHLRRLEGRSLPQFSVPQFLSLFFSFTFEQTDWNRYSSCLDTWKVFLSHVKQSSNSGLSSAKEESPAFRYRDSLITLSERVLLKVLFTSNAAQLEELDDEAKDGNMETERQKMLRQSIEIFVTAGELVNNQTLSLLNEPFQRCTAAYQSLASMATSCNSVVRLESKSQVKEMLALFQDLASLLQLIGRLCELHIGEQYQNHFEVGRSLVGKLLDLASSGSVVASLQFLGCTDLELKAVIAQVHAQCLSSLQAWCHWISVWIHADGPKELVNSIISALVTCASNIFTPAWPSSYQKEQVYLAGLQLLTSVVNVLRSASLWSCPAWNQLFVSVKDIRHLPPDIHRELMRCILSSTVLTWRNCSADGQHWQERASKLQSVIEQTTHSTRSVIEGLGRDPSNRLLLQGKPSVKATLALLADLASLVRDETTASKGALFGVVKPWVEPTLALLSYYARDHEVTEAVFHFYLSVFDSFMNQMGVERTEKAVQTFLQTFNQHNIQETLRQENIYGIRAVEQLLKILQIVVQEPGTVFRRFLSSTLTLCLDHIYPCIAQVHFPDLREAFYQLLTLVLRHHWRFFFKGSVLTTYGSRELDRSEPVENQGQFITMMNAYGLSFLLPDIAIFKQNLEALESLQSKWKLYHKAIFRDAVASQFISTLMDVLTNGSHELLREEISVAVYAMASPDFDVFFQQFLPNYLLNSQGVEDNQRLVLKNGFSNDTDLPTFTQNVHRLTNDLRVFRSANVSYASLYRT